MGYLNVWSVAPHTGAWIEITIATTTYRLMQVAPYTGAWIEIIEPTETTFRVGKSHPT